MAADSQAEQAQLPEYPGVPEAMDGTNAVVAMETAAGEAAGAYPITPASQMGEGWALAVARGERNVFGRRLLFFEPEGEHAAAAVTAGMSMVGLRAANFSASQGIAYMHESLYAAVGKRLTYVLNMACRAMTKQSLNIHCAHDDYHAVDDTGFFQLFAKDVQEAADLTLIAHRVAELSLTPGISAQDGFLTSHVIETLRLPERELIKRYLGDPADLIDTPTAAQRMVFGERRRRIPELFNFDDPAMVGTVQNQDSYAQGVAAQRPFFFDHVAELTDQAMAEFAAFTGRNYARATGYRTGDAEYLFVAQGSLVANAEAACDHLRDTRGIKIGVVNMTMFRPFPSDLITKLLRGKLGVTVLERVDQPLANDPPLLRELRAAVSKAMENGRARGTTLPYPGIEAYGPDDAPAFFSGCAGLGSRDVQPADILAAANNMLPGGDQQRQFYVGIEFVRAGELDQAATDWQARVLEHYPHVANLALVPTEDVNLNPPGALSLRIHSIGGWGAITMGKNMTKTLFDLLGLYVKSNPKYGSEKKGQPTTFFATFAHAPLRLNCSLRQVDVVMSPDPNVFGHSNPLAGLADGGVFIMQTDKVPAQLWAELPSWARKSIVQRQIRVFAIDAFAIARSEATDTELQYRMQGNAFQGAFFRTSPLMAKEGIAESDLFQAIEDQLRKTFGHKGGRVVEDNLRVIRRGYDEAHEVDCTAVVGEVADVIHALPLYLQDEARDGGLADRQRFQDQICASYRCGQDPISDPFAAFSAVPAATGVFRDMTGIRLEVPDFLAEKCTGCGQCWTQCPDAAIPGLVNDIEDVLRVAAADVANGKVQTALLMVLPKLATQARALLNADGFTSFAAVAASAYENVREHQEKTLSVDVRAELDGQFALLLERLREMPLAKTAPFFTVPERREPGTGGLLSITINPNACKGCMLCVEACADGALIVEKQTEPLVQKLRKNWDLWQRLPDTPDRFVQVRDYDRGVGVLHTMLLKKQSYLSMVGGDGACMGCGEKTCVHLVVSAIEASMQSRVEPFVAKLDGLIAALEAKAKLLLVSGADLDAVASGGSDRIDVSVSTQTREQVDRITKLMAELKDLRWRYVEGPTGRGRAAVGITNSTGCSSVWAGTYPYNPYPFPWANHLFQDAPSLAIGIFEGHMRKMGDGFAAVRLAELHVRDAWTLAGEEQLLGYFDWEQFSDEEFALCPPVLAIGGDGAMFDIGFQNVSRLLASNKPVRILVLDTQVYSNTGGQACSSSFLGQISDMAPYGKDQHGKKETRKELSYLALAHRGCFVLQSSQASTAHLISGVLRGIQSRRPAIFVIYTPCQAEHGISDSGAQISAKLTLESRAFPYFVYDPDAGDSLSGRLDLDGNPAVDQTWPSYELSYATEAGTKATMELPVTIADWAATQTRFGKHFKAVQPDDNQVPFAEFLELPAAEREGRVAFIYTVGEGNRLKRLVASPEIVALAQERLSFWADLKNLAGLEVSGSQRQRLAADLNRDFQRQLEALTTEYEDKLASLRASYPREVAQRIAEALVGARAGAGGGGGLLEMLSGTGATSCVDARVAQGSVGGVSAGPLPDGSADPDADEDDGGFGIDPYIEQDLCTTCDECTNLNPRIFAYNADKQAYIKDPDGGPFKDLVLAAERCPSGIIEPGTPRNPHEPDLEKWIERAAGLPRASAAK